LCDERSDRLEPTSFAAIAGWAEDDHAAAFAAFRRTCDALRQGRPALRPAAGPGAALLTVCEAARGLGDAPRGEAARTFFERHFTPVHVLPPGGDGFLTGYYEPVFEGSRTPDGPFQTPLLARPDDLVTVPQGQTLPGLPPGLQAARRTADGFAPYPDRAAIEGGAAGPGAEPLVYLGEPGEAFIVHVQGLSSSAVVPGRAGSNAASGSPLSTGSLPGPSRHEK
jgi:membrane-bound lytic murein transglycosylase A